MIEAARRADLICTLTGDIHVVRAEHFKVMKNGCMICNSGHFDVEIDLVALKKTAVTVREGVRNFVDEYMMDDGRKIFVLAEGRLINLSAAEGHPACVMDMSFSTQALASEYAVKNKGKLGKKVYDVPKEIDSWVASLKLKTMGISIDQLTDEQKKYLSSWDMGT